MGVSSAFLMSGHLERDAYAKLPRVAEEGNVAREILKTLYGLSTACKDWYKTIRNFLASECGGGGDTSLDKSVFCWAQRDFDYGYGVGFRGGYLKFG